jgi:hypothetical protein
MRRFVIQLPYEYRKVPGLRRAFHAGVDAGDTGEPIRNFAVPIGFGRDEAFVAGYKKAIERRGVLGLESIPEVRP